MCVTGRDPFRAGGLIVHKWSKHKSITAADYAIVSLVILLIMLSLLTIPIVFHMWINGCIACLKFTQSGDHIGDQSLGRSSNGFLGSHAAWSHDV
jgi:hypothetical protein